MALVTRPTPRGKVLFDDTEPATVLYLGKPYWLHDIPVTLRFALFRAETLVDLALGAFSLDRTSPTTDLYVRLAWEDLWRNHFTGKRISQDEFVSEVLLKNSIIVYGNIQSPSEARKHL